MIPLFATFITYLPSVEKVPVFVKASTEGHGGWSYLGNFLTEVKTVISRNHPHDGVV